MPQARRKSSGGGARKSRGKRGLVLLLLGVGIGVGGLYLWQLVSKSLHQRGGIANLVDSVTARPAPASEPARKEKAQDNTKTAKPRYEFYTLLQNETVLPDRDTARTEKSARAAKNEEGATYVLQAGSFANFDDADNLKARLALSGLVAHIQPVEVDGKHYHRVRLGPYDRIEQLDSADDQLKKLNIRALRQKVRKGA